MNRRILQKAIRKVAKEHGVSVSEVKQEIQHAIDIVFQNPTKTALAIPKKGLVPTPEEIIEDCCQRVLKKI